MSSAIHTDMVKIDTVVPYPEDYDETVRKGQAEVNRNYHPEIKPLGVNVSDYDVIVVGTPTWWYTMAPAVATFLENNDFLNKIVVLFMTNGGWTGYVIRDMEVMCKKTTIVYPKETCFNS